MSEADQIAVRRPFRTGHEPATPGPVAAADSGDGRPVLVFPDPVDGHPMTFEIGGRSSAPTAAELAAGPTLGMGAVLGETLRRIAAGSGDRERTQRDAVIAFTVRVTSAALLYLTQIVLARWMGSTEYGIYVFVWTWVLVLGGLSHLGLSLAMIRLLPAYREADELDLARGLVRGGRLAALGLGTLVAMLAIGGLWLLGPAVTGPYVLPLYIALACVPMFALTDVQDGIGRGQAWMDLALLPPYVLRPLLLLGAMLAAHLLGLPMRAESAAGAAIVATWGAAAVQTVFINRRLRAAVPAGARRMAFRDWFRISLPLVVIAACELVLQNADVLVISRYMTPADVGIYFAAAKTMSLILFVHYAVGSAVANRFAALNTRGDRDALRAFVRDAVNWTFWPSLASALLILVLGLPLLALFGPQFEAGYPVMAILVLGFLARAAMGPSEFLLNMLGEQQLCAAVLAVAAALDIALAFALVPAFGLVGAAAATSIALAVAAGLNDLVARRRLGIAIAIWHNVGGR